MKYPLGSRSSSIVFSFSVHDLVAPLLPYLDGPDAYRSTSFSLYSRDIENPEDPSSFDDKQCDQQLRRKERRGGKMSSCSSELSRSQEYLSFRSSVPLRKIVVDADGTKGWKVYDSSPKTIKCPLICLPPVSGTADVYFKQILGLAAKGYRVISAEPPVYWNVKEWCDGFRKLLDYMELDRVHLFGASLGGFLAQKFTEVNAHCPRVVSLVLCNTFTDTSVFNYNDSAAVFWILPSLVLKKMVMGNFTTDKVDGEIIEAIDFMVERLESLTQPELASRLTMNCVNCYVQPQKICHLPITIIDVFDEYALSNSVREEMYKCYPNAKLAHLKNGGNFPYLSRSAEVNLHLQIHLRQFEGTEFAASERSKT